MTAGGSDAGESPPSRPPYGLRMSGPARRALTETLPEKVAAAVYEFVSGPLLEEPRRVGKPLEPPLAPTFSARRGTYRVLYLVDDERHVVEVTAVRQRSDAYR